MVGGSALILMLAGGLQSLSRSQPASPCRQAIEKGTNQATAELCLGEDHARLGASAKESADRSRQLQEAARHYRRAVELADAVQIKVWGLDALVELFDAKHLDDPQQMEAVLRELIVLQPETTAPALRLAKALEDRGYLDAAEDTLLMARRQHPDAVDPYRMLAQFYARRATALHKDGELQKPPAPAAAGQPDEHGVYPIGGSMPPPQRLDRAVYPIEAQAAGIAGNVIAEVVIDPAGEVTGARIVNSIPLLDEAALQAVRNWHFAPTLVGGQPVPVRMRVTVNFTLSK